MCLLKVQEPRTGCLPCLYVSMWCDEEKNLETGLDRSHLYDFFSFFNDNFWSLYIAAMAYQSKYFVQGKKRKKRWHLKSTTIIS